MFFKKIRPISPSLRDKLVVRRLRSKKFTRLLLENKRSQGRNNYGSITSYCKGGGNSFQYRFVDYYNLSLKIPGIFLGYDFDNYRTG
jgi:ribosomal protein L2